MDPPRAEQTVVMKASSRVGLLAVWRASSSVHTLADL